MTKCSFSWFVYDSAALDRTFVTHLREVFWLWRGWPVVNIIVPVGTLLAGRNLAFVGVVPVEDLLGKRLNVLIIFEKFVSVTGDVPK